MTTRFVRALAAIALTFAVSCASADQAHSSVDRDAAEVEAFFMSGIEAFNRHDHAGFLQQFASDVEMYTPTGWLRGKPAVAERFATTFAQFPRVRMEIEDLRARSVGPDTVITSFRWRVFPRGSGPAYHGVGTGVYLRRGGSWEEVLEHETVTRVDPELQQPGR